MKYFVRILVLGMIVLILSVFGFTNIFSQKHYQDIERGTLSKMLKEKVVLVDIRRPDEWQKTGVISGSYLLTMFDGNGGLKEDFLPKFQQKFARDETIILICHVGNRTRVGSKILSEKLGYRRIYNVKHGIKDWIENRQPVVQIR